MPENVTLLNSMPVENIIHRTDSRPFSLYKVILTAGRKTLLQQLQVENYSPVAAGGGSIIVGDTCTILLFILS